MSSMDIRPAQPEDKSAIVSFCENTFSWGDYIADAWDRWIEDPDGKIFVGLVDTQPVAMVHVALLEKGVVWMEGMRVHPDFRRHGIGTAIDVAGRSYAREHGHPIAHLATSINNIPAQKALDVQGYTQIAEFDEWVASPSEGKPSQVRVAGPDDVPGILALWDHSDIRLATRSLLPDQWRWTELTEARLGRHTEAHQVRIVPGGFGLFSGNDEEEEPEEDPEPDPQRDDEHGSHPADARSEERADRGPPAAQRLEDAVGQRADHHELGEEGEDRAPELPPRSLLRRRDRGEHEHRRVDGERDDRERHEAPEPDREALADDGAGGEGGSLTLLCNSLSPAKRAMIRDIEKDDPLCRNIPIYLSRYGLRVWKRQSDNANPLLKC